MYVRLRKPLCLLTSFCLLLSACKKDDQPSAEEKRAADASYNNTLTAGVGNVLYEQKLVANSPSQLVFKMAYNQDTLAAYGKINGSGQLEYIHTTVLAQKGNTELLVTETFPAESLSRLYTISSGVKSNLVVEVEHYSAQTFTLSFVDLDWATGRKKVLKSTFFNNGVKSADYSGGRLMGDRVWNCDQPQPSDDLDQTADNHLDYHACGGLAWDTHPSLQAIKETITSAAAALKAAGDYKDKAAELNLLESAYAKMSALYAAIEGKVKGYKFENTLMAGLLKELEQRINELKKSRYDVLLVPFDAISDADYDEVDDAEVKLVFTVVDATTRQPFTGEPVFVDMAFVVPGTNTALSIQTRATSTANGLVTFKFDPTTIPAYQQYSSLEARYAFTSSNWQKTASRTVTLKFIKPKVVLADGSPVPSPVTYFSEQSRAYKLVNEDDRAINADYSQLSVSNQTNSSVGLNLQKGSGGFSVTLSTQQTTAQNTTFEVFYKSKKVQTISATVNDSTEMYRASVPGKYRVVNYKGNGPNSELYCEPMAGGRAVYTIYNDPSWADGYKFYASWSIVKKNGRYYYSESGFWHYAYPSIEEAYPLTYPVSSFPYHNGTVYAK